MFTLYKKEVAYYLNSPAGYIIIALFGVFSNFLFVKDIFIAGTASMQPFFNIMPWIFMIFIPSLSMRMFAEEKRQNTKELLLTLPLTEAEIVLAKFLAILTLVLIAIILTLSIPISISFLTPIYFPQILVGYAGQIMLACFFISISLFFSNKTSNQVAALLTSVLVNFILIVLASDIFTPFLPKLFQDILIPFTPLYALQSFSKGLFDIRSFAYFAFGAILLLYITKVDLENRD